MDPLILSLAGIVLVAVSAEWVAWRLSLPSILPLLVCGLLVGPVLGWLDPDVLLGDGIKPIVAFSAAIILYDGGLSLKFKELTDHGPVVRNLLTLGVIVNWMIVTLAGVMILDLNLALSVLIGAVAVITGPTAMGPILKHARLNTKINSILKWEGMLNGPIGGMLVVVAYEAVSQGLLTASGEVVPLVFLSSGFLQFVVMGVVSGLVGGQILLLLFRKKWVPDDLHEVVSLTLLLVTFVGTNMIVKDAGLLAATMMGMVIANQNKVPVKHVMAFKANLRLLLIALLFIILSARLNIADLQLLDWRAFAFVGVVMFVARPVGVWLSAFRYDLSWKEILFIGLLNPKGIVAASIAALASLQLLNMSPAFPQAEMMMPIVFLLILVTIVIYSLGVAPMARAFGLSEKNPQGVLLIGAHYWGRQIALALKEANHPVVLLDSNRSNIYAAKAAGLVSYNVSALSEQVIEQLDLGDIGYMLALTPNDEVNALASVRYSDLVDPKHIYQLQPTKRSETNRNEPLAPRLRGHLLFHESMTYPVLTDFFSEGGQIHRRQLFAGFDYDTYRATYGKRARILFILDEDNNLRVNVAGQVFSAPQVGETIIALITPGATTPQ